MERKVGKVYPTRENANTFFYSLQFSLLKTMWRVENNSEFTHFMYQRIIIVGCVVGLHAFYP